MMFYRNMAAFSFLIEGDRRADGFAMSITVDKTGKVSGESRNAVAGAESKRFTGALGKNSALKMMNL